MPSIRLRNICNYICNNINLDIQDGELFVLLGPTGSGKTTLLNVIAGLVEYKGNVLFDDAIVDKVPPERRGIGYLPQNLVLFPHLDVASNIGYSLKVRGKLENHVEERVDELLKTMGIEHLKHRYPKNLSGGERQRVALARALANNPKVLLLDEPLSNLDPRTSNYLRLELRELQRKLSVTTIFVTHDMAEAEEMSDRVGVVYKGEILQVSSLSEIIFSPKNRNIFNFIGELNILSCNSYKVLGGLAEVDCDGIPIIAPYEGDPIRKIVINPRDIFISMEQMPGPHINLFKGTIVKCQVDSSVVNVQVKLGDNLLLASELPREVYDSQDFAKGKEVFIKMKLKAIRTSS